MKCLLRKRKYLTVIVFVLANLCYFFGMILKQFESVTGSANATDGSAESRFLQVLDAIPFVQYLDEYSSVIQGLLALICLGISLIFVCRFGVRLLREKWYVIVYVWSYAILFLSYDQFDSFYKNYGFEGVDLSFFNKMIIFALTLSATVFLARLDENRKELLKGYLEKHNGVFLCVVLLYIDFACSGQRLFLSSQERAWDVNMVTISIFILFAYWLAPFVFMLLCFLENQKGKSKAVCSENAQKISIREKLTLWSIPVVTWVIYWIICYPAVIPMDGIDAWREVLRGGTFSTAFPAVIKVVWRFLYHIVPTVGIVSLFQILLLATLLTAYLIFFREKGMSKRVSRRIAFAFAVLPSSCLYVITHGSNIYYTISILWVLYFLIRVIDDGRYLQEHHLSVLWLGCALAGTYLCRNEGFAVVILICFLFMILTIRYKTYSMVIGILLAVGIISLSSHLVYNSEVAADDVTISNHGGISLINDVTLATLYFGGNISEEDLDTLQKYASVEDIAAKYTDFQYDTTTRHLINDYMEDSEKASAIAFRCIVNNIDIAFRERLNKSECVWNVLNTEGAYLDRCSRGIVENDIGLKANNSILTKICQEVLYFPTFMFCVTDIFLYRSGIYVCILLVFALYWIKNKNAKQLWCFTPIFAHFIVMLLVLLWSCSRHTWCINLMATVVIIYGLLTIRRDDQQNTEKVTVYKVEEK